MGNGRDSKGFEFIGRIKSNILDDTIVIVIIVGYVLV